MESTTGKKIDSDPIAAVFPSVEEFDQAALKSIAARTAKRKKREFLFTALLVISILLLSFLCLKFFLASQTSQGSQNIKQEADQHQILDPQLEIDQLESKLHKPGRTVDYLRLGKAYLSRYQQTGRREDLMRSEEMLSRYKELKSKQLLEVDMRKNLGFLFFAICLILILALLSLVAMFFYNSLASADENVDARWAQVEAVLQRRLDLVPQLVEVVRGYAAHEQKTFVAVTEARSRMLSIMNKNGKESHHAPENSAPLQDAQQAFDGALKQLLVIAEQYPDLKASTQFVTLQDQLEGTENRISTERQRYNDAVLQFNGQLRKFPGNVVGSFFGFSARSYFEAAPGAEKPAALKLVE